MVGQRAAHRPPPGQDSWIPGEAGPCREDGVPAAAGAQRGHSAGTVYHRNIENDNTLLTKRFSMVMLNLTCEK